MKAGEILCFDRLICIADPPVLHLGRYPKDRRKSGGIKTDGVFGRHSQESQRIPLNKTGVCYV